MNGNGLAVKTVHIVLQFYRMGRQLVLPVLCAGIPDVFRVLGTSSGRTRFVLGSVLAFKRVLTCNPLFPGAMTRTEERRRESSMVQSISNFFSMILNWLYSVVPNYPVDIILMTILLKLILEPLLTISCVPASLSAVSRVSFKRLQRSIKMIHNKRLSSSLSFTRNTV